MMFGSSTNTNQLIRFPFRQFMKFVKRLGDGEITIQDNAVVEKSPQQRSEAWAQQYVEKQVRLHSLWF